MGYQPAPAALRPFIGWNIKRDTCDGFIEEKGTI